MTLHTQLCPTVTTLQLIDLTRQWLRNIDDFGCAGWVLHPSSHVGRTLNLFLRRARKAAATVGFRGQRKTLQTARNAIQDCQIQECQVQTGNAR